MADQLFENSRLVTCPQCGAKHLERRMCECLRRHAVPSAEERAAWYAANRTDVPREIRRSQLPWMTRLLAWVVRKIGGGW